MAKTILYVASGTPWAGAEMQVYTLMDASKDKLTVKAVLFNDETLADKLRECGIEVFIIDESKYGLFKMIKEFCNILTEVKVDLIHTHGYKENIIGSIAGLLKGIPSVRTAHGDDEFKVSLWDLKRSIPAHLNLFSGRFLQKKIISVSTELREKLAKKYPKSKINVIPNGLNIDKVSAKAEQLIKIPGNSESFKLVFFGRLVTLKRVDLILETYALLFQAHGLDYELYIVGDGVEADSLKKLAESLNILSGTHFLGHRLDVHHLMQQMDCLIMASDHEGLPMTILEAVASKLPIVSHAVGEIPNVLDNGNCGYLVYEQKPEKFKQAIENCRTSSNTKQMVDDALSRLRQHYSHEKNSQAHVELYHEVLKA